MDLLLNKEIQLVVNSPSGQTPRSDEVKIRTTSVYTGVPIITTLGSAKAAVSAISTLKEQGYSVAALQDFHRLMD